VHLKYIIFSLFILMYSSVLLAEEIEPFTTDGCSSFPDGTIEQQSLWTHCCVQHDLAYWKGGTYQQRLEADEALSSCVYKVGEKEIAELMLAGVRVGGTPYLPTSFRWGYGWPFPKVYKALTENEKQKVEEKLNQFERMIQTMIKSIRN